MRDLLLEHNNKFEATFEVSESTDDFDTYISKDYVSNENKINLRSANILIVPQEGYHVTEEPLFPAGTEHLYLFLNENLPDSCNLNICVDDDKYQELSLHHEWAHIGLFVLEKAVLPLFLACMKDYISKLILQKGANNIGIKLKMNIIREKGKSVSINYEGPAEAFSDIAKRISDIK